MKILYSRIFGFRTIFCLLGMSAILGCGLVLAPAAECADDATITRKLNALKFIWSDVEANPVGSTKRDEYLREFQTRSAVMLDELTANHSALGGLWTLRAGAACELKDGAEAIRAGTRMIALGLDKSPNDLSQRTMAMLERKGWIQTPEQEAIEAALKKAGENTLGMRFKPVPGTKVLFSVWETRVQDYELFIQSTGLRWFRPDFVKEASHPAVNISWEDAKSFCRWLSKKEGKTYRLPTDEEWSWAAGIGKRETGNTPKAKDGKILGAYPWGTQWPPPSGIGNFALSLQVDSFEHTSPVGSFKPNPYGLYDLDGNARKWCEDFYETESRGDRVKQGGCWTFGDDLILGSSWRGYGIPTLASSESLSENSR